MKKVLILVIATLAVTACSSSEQTTTTPLPTGTVPVRTEATPPPVPQPRRSHTMTSLEPGRILVTGGLTFVGNSSAWLGDTWVLNTVHGTWEQLGDIPVRGQHAVASSGRNTFLFGGYAGTDFVYGDMRELVAENWIDIVDSSRPSARAGAVMAYDSESERFVLFGGDVSPFDARLPTNETWEFSVATSQWVMRSPEPAPRPKSEGHPTLFELSLTYDGSADRLLLLIGGDELWAYDTNTNTWEERAAPDLEADYMVAAAYHAGIERLVAYGGAPTAETAETWTYSYATNTWELIATQSSPGLLADHAMAYDPHTDAVYLYGGTSEVLSLSEPPTPSGQVWVFDGADWALIHPASAASMP